MNSIGNRKSFRKAKQTGILDQNALVFNDFLPPGRHFFYFVKSMRHYFLSPRYPIVSFKDSHIYLNEIVVYPRLEPLTE